MVLLYFLRLVRSGAADSSASEPASGRDPWSDRGHASVSRRRSALLGWFGARNLVCSSAHRPDSRSHLLRRAERPATVCFHSLGNRHFRDRHLPLCWLVDVAVRSGPARAPRAPPRPTPSPFSASCPASLCVPL